MTSSTQINPNSGTSPAELALLDMLQQTLGERALAADVVDIAWATADSPIGPLLLAATPRGLVRLAFESEDADQVLDDLAHRISPKVLRAPARLDPARRQLDEYFGHRRHRFNLPLDHALSRGFGLVVRRHLAEIDFGHTESYGEVARSVGNPGAVRAVGTACAGNPIPIVVPCHRVLRSDGSLGGYRGGAEAKRVLLDLERLDLEQKVLQSS